MTKKFRRGPGRPNPVNTGPPREFVVLVGSPSNTFNGYYYHDESVTADGGFVAMPHPRNLKGVPRYIHGYPERRMAAVTHDLYWANFLDPAVRLLTTGIVKPKPGDLVTFMVYAKGYLTRQAVDWDASPYNTRLHQNSPWVSGKPEFDPYAKDKVRPPPSPPPDRNPSGGTKVKPAPKVVASEDPDHVLNHDILMRTTSANKDDILKRPTQSNSYERYLHDLPRRIVYGKMLGGSTAVLPDVMVRLLLFNEPSVFTDYMATGRFPGQYWRHPLDTADEEDMASTALPDEEGSFWDAALAISRRWERRWKRILKSLVKPPDVERSKVKVKRFDYIGHSGATSFMVLYGWSNEKGEVPDKEIERIKYADQWEAIPKDAFSKDAYAHLWGCSLGRRMAWELTDRFKKVAACEMATDFERILDSDQAMPTPTDGSPFKIYEKKNRPAAVPSP